MKTIKGFCWYEERQDENLNSGEGKLKKEIDSKQCEILLPPQVNTITIVNLSTRFGSLKCGRITNQIIPS